MKTVDKLKQRVSDLQDLLGEIQQGLDQGKIPAYQAVALGHKIWLLFKDLNATFEPLKAFLRDEARRISKDTPGPQYFHGDDGTECTISILPPAVKVRKEANNKAAMGALEVLLRDDFKDYFEEKVTYKPRKGFRSKTAAIKDPTVTQAVMGVIDVEDQTPRVFFKD